jgi:hypothetical protein
MQAVSDDSQLGLIWKLRVGLERLARVDPPRDA